MEVVLSYVRYIDKTREYYRAEGYEKPYQWANFDDVPFTPLKKPLSESRLALISTSEISIKTWDDQRTPQEKGEAGNVYAVPTDTPVDALYSLSHSFDKHATTLDDVNAFFPVSRLAELAAEGRFASLAPTAHGVYNAYSQRKTREVDAPEVLRRCREEAVDVALLTPV
jgi:D-proline reductase (dithiol) PrdB